MVISMETTEIMITNEQITEESQDNNDMVIHGMVTSFENLRVMMNNLK